MYIRNAYRVYNVFWLWLLYVSECVYVAFIEWQRGNGYCILCEARDWALRTKGSGRTNEWATWNKTHGSRADLRFCFFFYLFPCHFSPCAVYSCNFFFSDFSYYLYVLFFSGLYHAVWVCVHVAWLQRGNMVLVVPACMCGVCVCVCVYDMTMAVTAPVYAHARESADRACHLNLNVALPPA